MSDRLVERSDKLSRFVARAPQIPSAGQVHHIECSEAADPQGWARPDLRTDGVSENLDTMKLARTIEGEVIPRLMLALTSLNVPSAEPAPSFMPTVDHVAELVAHSLSLNDNASSDFIDHMLSRGMTLDTIYLHLIAPAARSLGVGWEDDTMDFVQVTIGLGRLQTLVHKLNPRPIPRIDDALDRPRRALLCTVEGEQHSLGCAIVAGFFKRAGWSVTGWPLTLGEDAVRLVADQPFDVVGLSISAERNLGVLVKQIEAIRAASCNRDVLVMVGGRIFSDNAALIHVDGADFIGRTGSDAVEAAEAMMQRGHDRIEAGN